MPRDYVTYNGAAPLAAAITPVAVAVPGPKTMLQLAPPATLDADVLAWGVSFDGTAANQPVKAELIETDVAATVAAHVAAGIIGWNQPAELASQMTLGTAASGYSATAEGTIAAVRLLDYEQLPPTAPFMRDFVPGDRPKLRPGRFLRVRLSAANAVNVVCWVAWSE